MHRYVGQSPHDAPSRPVLAVAVHGVEPGSAWTGQQCGTRRRHTQVLGLASVEDGIAAIRAGHMVILVGSGDREDEGDLVMAAQHVGAADVNFMATFGRGLICVPMEFERLDELRIPPMAVRNTDPHQTAFHVGVDCSERATTGISASDRARAVRMLASASATAESFRQPGHVFPLAYRPGGVLRRPGHTEASVDLARLAECQPAACICEIAQPDGEMARLPALLEFGRAHQLPVVLIKDVVDYRRRTETLVRRGPSARMPLAQGAFSAIGYEDLVDGREHVALVLGTVCDQPSGPVHVHFECVAGDAFGARSCDCRRHLKLGLDKIGAAGRGVLVYIRGHERRGTVLSHYGEESDWVVANQILADLGAPTPWRSTEATSGWIDCCGSRQAVLQ